MNLAILDGPAVVFIERMLGTKALGMHSEAGRRERAHSTALGKAILSCYPFADVKAFIATDGLSPVTPKTISDPDKFLAELDQGREQGYAIDDKENEIGGRCIGVPIFDHTGNVVAAVSISTPTRAFATRRCPSDGRNGARDCQDDFTKFGILCVLEKDKQPSAVVRRRLYFSGGMLNGVL